MDHPVITIPIGKQIFPNQQSARLAFHIYIERSKVCATALQRRIEIQQERKNPFAGIVRTPVSGIKVIIKFAMTWIICRLPVFKVRTLNSKQSLQTHFDLPQHRVQLTTEPFLMSGFAHSMLSQLISTTAIRLSPICQAGLPGHILQFFEYVSALRFRKKLVYEEHFIRNKCFGKLTWHL